MTKSEEVKFERFIDLISQYIEKYADVLIEEISTENNDKV